MTSSPHPVYLEIIDFIAAGTTPEQIVSFRPSPAVQERTESLVARGKEESLSPEEQAELNYLCQLEHILRLAKAQAQSTAGDRPLQVAGE